MKRNWHTWRRSASFLALALGVAAAGLSSYRLLRYARAERATRLIVTGSIEATIVAASFKVPGRMIARFVDEGDVVTTGQALAVLDRSDYAIDVGVRSSQVAVAAAALAALEHGTRPEEIEEGQAALARAQADLVRTQRDYQRAEDLLSREVISGHEYDAARSAYDAATAQVAVAQAHLRLLELGPRSEEIDQARAALQTAREQLAASAQRLADAALFAPLTGVVLSKDAEPGEYVLAGTPVVALADLSNVWLRAYVNETDLGRVRLDQRARVTTDTYPHRVYEGRLAFIASEAEFTPKTVYTETQRVKLVYRLKINLSNPAWELKPGMPAVAEIVLQ